MKYIFFIFLFCLSINISAQNTQQVLSLEQLYEQIIQNHPLVKQAELWNEYARQEIRLARGGFDPKINLSYRGKEFEKKNYYDIWEAKVKVPVWAGDVKVTYDNNEGEFLNPERSNDNQGILGVGLSLPIARGLLIDKRRATLRQAKFYQNIAEAERFMLINKTLLDATKDYWEWYNRHNEYRFLQEGYELAKLRFEGVKVRISLGELAAIDSVEAKITLQNREILLKQSRIDLNNARLILSNHFWDENNTPLEIVDGVTPEEFSIKNRYVEVSDLQSLQTFAEENHPKIQKSVAKLNQLGVEERLQFNNLLPKINLDYNLLRNYRAEDEKSNFRSDNYKLGVSFEFPIFLRKERGKLQQVRIKQNQTNFELRQMRRTIQNDIQTAYNELKNFEEIILLQESMVQNYEILRNGELRKFQNGESSLFLINSRESKLIEAQIKLVSQKTKYEKARAKLYYKAGRMLNE